MPSEPDKAWQCLVSLANLANLTNQPEALKYVRLTNLDLASRPGHIALTYHGYDWLRYKLRPR